MLSEKIQMTRKAHQDDRPIMPAGKLSAVRVRNLSEPGLYSDGLGLYLQISKWKSKAWVFRYMRQGKAHKLGLGPCHTVSLREAREAALEARSKARKGIDPIAERKAALGRLRAETAKLVTFADCAERFIDSARPGWRNPKSEDQWRSSLATYAYPIIGDLPVASVDIGLVSKVLEPHWASKTETMSRLRGRIETILDWAKVRGYRSGENPAAWKGNLKSLLPAPAKVKRVEHHAALPYAEMPTFMSELRAKDGVAARALEFLILTAGRLGEISGATWTEIDVADKVWSIPGDRMKGGRAHVVPLSPRALTILEAMPRTGERIFSAGYDMAVRRCLISLRQDVTIHGFRSSFRDWCGDMTTFPREVAEAALAHATGDETERAYRRGTALEQRRRLMDAWAAYCERPTAASDNVVSMRA
jgi:integrase